MNYPKCTKTLLLTFLFHLFLSFNLNSQSQITVTRLTANNEGFAAWNADGTGSEPAKTGHVVSTFGTAYYCI